MGAFSSSIKNLFKSEKTKLKVHWILHGAGSNVYREVKGLTEETEGQLAMQGYTRCFGLIDDAAYFNVPVYLKLSNFREYQLTEDDCRDNAYTLGDYQRRNTQGKVNKIFSKISSMNMDKKAIGVIIIVIAIAAGFIFLFGGSFHG